MGRIGLAYDDVCIGHTQGPGHPERPERLTAVSAALGKCGVEFIPIDVAPASAVELKRNHTAEHIGTIEATCRDSLSYPDPDIEVVPESWAAALYAAGSGVAACKAVLNGDVDQAFCAVRPPGHHAEGDRAMGFCLFNNIAIAARWLREEGGVSRVAILDWDVHHGNGTQHSTYDDDTIYYISLHQYPFYPGTGHPSERGKNNTNLNVCMDAGMGPDEWLGAFEEKVLPELEAFAPDVLLISAGFDAHERDPLGSQRLTAETYAEMTRKVKHIAGGQIVSMLEGGYDLQGLAESAAAHVQALATL